MKRNYKFGFSYIELVFAMAIVVILMALSAPFLTRKSQVSSSGSSYGEYQCWAAYENDEWVLYERSRYNTNDFDYPSGRKVTQCRFLKPVGASDFELTLVSGGGGGSMPEFDTAVLENGNIDKLFEPIDTDEQKCSEEVSYNGNTYSDCKIVRRDYSMKVKLGKGGDSGNVARFKTTLNGVFDSDNEIKINICDTDYDSSLETKKDKNARCIGKGGEGAKYNESEKNRGTTMEKFFELLKVYDDRLYCPDNSTCSGYGGGYFGTGNGRYSDQEDEATLSEYFDIEKKPVENIHASDIKNVLKSLTSTVEIGENTASKGDYTHFYTGENSNADNEYCKGGNCLVPGGDYGITRGYEYQNIKVTNKCTMLSGGEKGYYCFGSDFESQSAGKYDTRVAQGGNPVVQIGNPKLDDKFFNSPVAYSDADSILPNESNGMHVYDNVNSTNFGAGGGGGGFTMFISKEPSCTLVKLNGKIDVYVDTAYKLTSVTNTEKTVFKDKITCKEGALSKNGYKVTLKRTNGGRGNGGAVIIKW